MTGPALRHRPFLSAGFLAMLAFGASMAPAVHAATLTVQVADGSGQPLADAAVYAEPLGAPPPPHPHKAATIEQKGRKFIPLVTVVETGSEISFPNNDSVRHHVYSLSPAKVFDIKLYAGDPPHPIVFDKPGTVVIGCNIHDRMLAYVHVVATPWRAMTDAAGQARLEGLPAGQYRLKAWHYGLPPGTAPLEQGLTMTASDSSASLTLNAKAR